MAVPVFQRASGSTGTSHTIDIGVAGNNRLVAVFMGDESTPGDTFQGDVTVDGKLCNKIAVADNPDGAGSHLELHAIDESALGASNGSVTVSYSGGDIDWAIHVIVYYGVQNDTVVDVDKEDVVVGNLVSVENINSNAYSLVIMGANNGSSGAISGWTSPLVQRTEGPHPLSAIMGTASGLETTAQTNKTYSVNCGTAALRSTGIVAVFDRYTVGGGGWAGGDINGVTSLGAVNTVADANIGTINTV